MSIPGVPLRSAPGYVLVAIPGVPLRAAPGYVLVAPLGRVLSGSFLSGYVLSRG